MKKVLVALVLITALAIPSFAEFNINISSGYTYLGMQSVNNSLADYLTTLNNTVFALGFTGTGFVNNLNNAFYIALEADYTISPNLMLGPRIEYINAFETQIQFSGLNSESTENLNLTGEDGASLIPIMLGISYKSAFQNIPLSIKGGVYLGYGFAGSFDNISGSISAPGIPTITDSDNINMSGSGFVGEALLSADWSFSSMISLGLNVGYRKADISQMTYSQSVNDSLSGIYVNKGDTVKDFITGAAVDYDFSGLILGLAVNLCF